MPQVCVCSTSITFAVSLNQTQILSLAVATVTNRNLSSANSSGMRVSKHSLAKQAANANQQLAQLHPVASEACVSESVTRPQFSWPGTGPSSGRFYHSSNRWLISLYHSHHNYNTPVSHHCLLSISVNGPHHTKQYLSAHLAAEIQSDICTLCCNLVVILQHNAPC